MIPVRILCRLLTRIATGYKLVKPLAYARQAGLRGKVHGDLKVYLSPLGRLNERTAYPQNWLNTADRFIKPSSNNGKLALAVFCGCVTMPFDADRPARSGWR